MPTAPRQVPASHAPYSARLRASRFAGSRTTTGSASPSARIDSSAIRLITGFASSAYNASTACAIALMPDAAEMSGGSDNVSDGS